MPTKKEILAAVSKSGYLLDQEVATTLEDLGFHVQTSWPFEDPDKGESRELDVWAIRPIIDGKSPQVFVELFCECKSGENRPLAFLGRRKGKIDENVCPIHFMFPHKTYEQPIPNGYREVKAFSYFEGAKYHYWYKADQKAVQFAKIVRRGNGWEAQHDGLYNSLLLPLAKALNHRAEMVRRSDSVHLCFPIVVLKSPIYWIDSATTPLETETVSHVTFFRRLDSQTVKGEYLVDFVTTDGLTEFISRKVMPFVESIAEMVSENPRRFLKQRS